MKRLKSTKSIFQAKIHTTATLLYKTEQQIDQDYKTLNKLHGILLRTTREKTLKRFHNKLSITAAEMRYPTPKSYDRGVMLRKINIYKRHHSFLRYTAIEHACARLCSIYEDFIRRVILKHYEENILKLKSEKESIKNWQLVDLLLNGHNLHRALAEKVVNDLMYGPIEEWYKALENMGMNIILSNEVRELFLVRNCIVHNDKKVSAQLSIAMPDKYKMRRDIRLKVEDFEHFMNSLQRSAYYVISEYNRLFPINAGTWLGVNYD